MHLLPALPLLRLIQVPTLQRCAAWLGNPVRHTRAVDTGSEVQSGRKPCTPTNRVSNASQHAGWCLCWQHTAVCMTNQCNAYQQQRQHYQSVTRIGWCNHSRACRNIGTHACMPAACKSQRHKGCCPMHQLQLPRPYCPAKHRTNPTTTGAQQLQPGCTLEHYAAHAIPSW